MHAFLNRIFGVAEEINGGHRCPTYMFRWTILATRGGKLYLHKFVGDDWSLDLHDHPKRFVSIGVWGRYEETVFGPSIDNWPEETRTWRAPWIRTFPATHRHRIHGPTPIKPCWTLVWVGRPERNWGFWHEGRFMPWLDYVRGKDGIADKMKACD